MFKKNSLARAALDVAVPYAAQRKQFDTRIGDFQLVAAKLADGWTRTQAARALVYSAAAKADAKKEDDSSSGGAASSSSPVSVAGGWRSKGERARECAAAILFSAETATAVALDALQVLGGNGYINEYPTGDLWKFFFPFFFFVFAFLLDLRRARPKETHETSSFSLSTETLRPHPPRRQAVRDRGRHLGDQAAGHREGADAGGRRAGGREVKEKGRGERGKSPRRFSFLLLPSFHYLSREMEDKMFQ